MRPGQSLLGALNYVDSDLSDVKSISKCGFYLGQGSRCANKPEVDGYWIFIAFKSHDASFYPIYAMDSGNTKCYCGILNANSLTWNRLDNFGCSTPADLASLLGGIMLNANDAGFNFNNLETFGTYAITNSENWDNKPSEANGSGFVICGGWIYDGNRRTLQVLYLQDNTAYFRAYNPVSSSWQSWQKFSFDIPTFYKDYADLSALASALGASMTFLGDEADLNNLLKAGFYYTNSVDTIANKPVANLYNNTIWVLKNPISDRTTQLFFCINESRTFIRYKVDTGWAAWKEISTDIPSFYKNYSDLSSLATALGAPVNGTLDSSIDLNNITSAGYYEVINGNKPLNFPSGVGGNALVEVRNCYGKNRIIQTVYDCQSSTAIVTRYYNGSTWGNWLRNDNYGTSSLSDLASALGGWKEKRSIINGNLDTLEDGWYHIRPEDGGTIIGCPSQFNGSLYMSRGSDNNRYYFYQMYFSIHTEQTVYVRTTIDHTTWSTWKEIAFDIPTFYKNDTRGKWRLFWIFYF